MAGAIFPPPLKRKRQPENAQTSREKLSWQLQYDRKILNWKSTFMYEEYVNKKCSLFLREGFCYFLKVRKVWFVYNLSHFLVDFIG
jgi:hypothetical protein